MSNSRKTSGIVVATLATGLMMIVVAPAHAVLEPAAPTNLVAEGGDATVSLSWEASSHTFEISKYRIQRESAGSSVVLETADSITSFTDSGLANGTTYTYRVAAVDGLGQQGAWSEAASATPQQGSTGGGCVAPSAPQNLRADVRWNTNGGQVTLRWDPPASDCGSAIIAYRVYKNWTGSFIAEVPAHIRHFNDRLKGDGATYSVTAVNALGESEHAAVSVSRGDCEWC